MVRCMFYIELLNACFSDQKLKSNCMLGWGSSYCKYKSRSLDCVAMCVRIAFHDRYNYFYSSNPLICRYRNWFSA